MVHNSLMTGFLPHENALLSALQKEINRGLKLRIDVGLSYGMPYTLRWVTNDKNVVVMGFEPHQENYRQCEKILAEIEPEIKKRIFVFNLALTNRDDFEDHEFWATKSSSEGVDTGRSSLLKPQEDFQGWVKERYLVRTAPIFRLLETLTFEHIEFVKVDTQGFDLRVLKGFREYLEKILVIMVEADSSKYYQEANNSNDLENHLNSLSFRKIAELSPKNQESESPSDLLFMNSKITFYRHIPRPIGYHLKHNFFNVLLIAQKEPIDFTFAILAEVRIKIGSTKWKFENQWRRWKSRLLKLR